MSPTNSTGAPAKDAYADKRTKFKINSKSLFDRFRDEYESLIDNCAVVCSAPGVFFGGGEHTVLRGGISVCQAFPQRVWVGLEPSRYGDTIEICDLYQHRIFSASDLLFQRTHREGHHREEWAGNVELADGTNESMLNLLVGEIRHMCSAEGLDHYPSFRIHLLSEYFPRYGGNWSGAFSAALAGAILTLCGKLDKDKLKEWGECPGYKLAADPLFDLCNRWAWHFETVLHGGSASGYGTFCSLVGGRTPQKQSLLNGYALKAWASFGSHGGQERRSTSRGTVTRL